MKRITHKKIERMAKEREKQRKVRRFSILPRDDGKRI